MALRLTITDSGTEAWRQVERALKAGCTAVCVPLARDQVLERAGGVVFGRDTILGLEELYAAVADALPDAPPRPRSHLVRLHGLRELLRDATLPNELTALHDRGAENLLAWLDRVEERADRDHRDLARTPVECGVEQLRESLADEGLLSGGAWRARIARAAKEVRHPRPLLIAPQDLSGPATSGLLKGLGARQEVSVVGLSPPAGVAGWLEAARLGPDWGTDSPSLVHTRDDAVAAFASGRASQGSLELLAAGDELEAALGVIAGWRREGIPGADTAIVCPSAEAALVRLEERALALGVPITGRLRAGLDQAQLGPLIAGLADDPVDPVALAEAARRRIGQALVRAVADAPTAPERVVALARLAQETGLGADRGALAARDMHLAEALLDAAEEAAALEPVPGAAEIVAAATGRTRTLGDPEGVAVVGYPEACGVGRRHLVVLGLAAGQWPQRPRPSPFASAELLAGAPGLAPRDRGAEFASCLCAAERAVLVRQARDGNGRELPPSVLWVAAEAAGATPRAPAEAVGRRTRGLAARPAREAHERTRVQAAERLRFTVDEIAAYLDCPLGWFAAQHLPAAPRDREAANGEAAHAALAAAFNPALNSAIPVEARQQLARSMLDREAQAGRLAAADAIVLADRCARVIARYSPPAWPFRTVAVERELEMPAKDGETVITGRLDRIDADGDAAVVIDYKLNRVPEPAPRWRLLRTPQATLYPLMVDRRLPPLTSVGTLFVSLARADHDGLASGDDSGPWGPNVVLERSLLRKPAVDMAMEAIEGMREGRIERNPYHSRGCPCRSLPWDPA
jgi:hypothetical protein